MAHAFPHTSIICEQATDGSVIGVPAPNDGCWHTSVLELVQTAIRLVVRSFFVGLKW